MFTVNCSKHRWTYWIRPSSIRNSGIIIHNLFSPQYFQHGFPPDNLTPSVGTQTVLVIDRFDDPVSNNICISDMQCSVLVLVDCSAYRGL
jgi:hypothetical protein